ncbi:hypothetical protein [Streptomyces sp. NPDC055400]
MWPTHPPAPERAAHYRAVGAWRDRPVGKAIGKHLTGREVAAQKIPESLFLVDALPYTTSGKVRKFALREWLRDRAGASWRSRA